MALRDSPTAGWSIALWLFFQVLALGIAAARIPLWASAPPASEHLALAILIATQIGASSLLFPHLVRGRSALLIAVAIGWPMAELGSFLADSSTKSLLCGEGYVTVWLIALNAWARILNRQPREIFGMASAVIVSFGGVFLAYLRTDYGDFSPTTRWPSSNLLGPILGAISQLDPQQVAIDVWILPLALIALAWLLGLKITRKNRAEKSGAMIVAP